VRLALLQLLDGLMEAPDTARAFTASGANAALTLQRLLLPPLVWRAGKAAAAVRFAGATALATLMASPAGPPPPDVLLAAVQPAASPSSAAAPAAASPQQQQQQQQQQQPPADSLLPLLFQLLDDDWYADLRHTACFVVTALLQQVGAALSDASRRALYPELLRRLDDSSNKVCARLGGGAADGAVVCGAGVWWCGAS
jgi:dynein assembly factor 5